MNKKQFKELKQLAKGLLKVPEEKFDMAYWGDGKLDLRKKGFTCDYSGCAIGWAPKLIKNCGLKLRRTSDGSYPVYADERHEYAVMKYFGIHHDECVHLFFRRSNEDENTPSAVSTRILRFLETVLELVK